MQCKRKLCTQKYCMGSLELKQRLDVIAHFHSTFCSAVIDCRIELVCLFVHVRLSVSRSVLVPLVTAIFFMQHTKAGDVKWCLTNIFSEGISSWLYDLRHMEQPWSILKPENSTLKFSAHFILACRPNSLGISVYISVSACECVCVVSMVTVGGRCIREYKTVILSVHSRAINSMITHQSGCCVWLHNHRSKSHSHSAPSYQGGYCFNPLLRGSERGCVEPICQAGWCKCTGALNTGR